MVRRTDDCGWPPLNGAEPPENVGVSALVARDQSLRRHDLQRLQDGRVADILILCEQ